MTPLRSADLFVLRSFPRRIRRQPVHTNSPAAMKRSASSPSAVVTRDTPRARSVSQPPTSTAWARRLLRGKTSIRVSTSSASGQGEWKPDAIVEVEVGVSFVRCGSRPTGYRSLNIRTGVPSRRSWRRAPWHAGSTEQVHLRSEYAPCLPRRGYSPPVATAPVETLR